MLRVQKKQAADKEKRQKDFEYAHKAVAYFQLLMHEAAEEKSSGALAEMVPEDIRKLVRDFNHTAVERPTGLVSEWLVRYRYPFADEEYAEFELLCKQMCDWQEKQRAWLWLHPDVGTLPTLDLGDRSIDVKSLQALLSWVEKLLQATPPAEMVETASAFRLQLGVLLKQVRRMMYHRMATKDPLLLYVMMQVSNKEVGVVCEEVEACLLVELKSGPCVLADQQYFLVERACPEVGGFTFRCCQSFARVTEEHPGGKVYVSYEIVGHAGPEGQIVDHHVLRHDFFQPFWQAQLACIEASLERWATRGAWLDEVARAAHGAIHSVLSAGGSLWMKERVKSLAEKESAVEEPGEAKPPMPG